MHYALHHNYIFFIFKKSKENQMQMESLFLITKILEFILNNLLLIQSFFLQSWGSNSFSPIDDISF